MRANKGSHESTQGQIRLQPKLGRTYKKTHYRNAETNLESLRKYIINLRRTSFLILQQHSSTVMLYYCAPIKRKLAFYLLLTFYISCIIY